MRRTPTEPHHDLRGEFGMACPKCGQADKLSVEITCTATLTIDGTDADCDHYWDAASSCHCDDCDLHGSVGDFRITRDWPVRS